MCVCTSFRLSVFCLFALLGERLDGFAQLIKLVCEVQGSARRRKLSPTKEVITNAHYLLGLARIELPSLDLISAPVLVYW